MRDKVLWMEIWTKKQFYIKEGQFLISKIDARNGAFGIVPTEVDKWIITWNFWTFDIDESIVDRDYFLSFISTNAFDEICEKTSSGTTNRKYLDEKKFLKFEIQIPETIEEQKWLVQTYLESQKNFLALKILSDKNERLIKSLRSSILQDAIQWRLVPQDPSDEPASILIEKIQAEKMKLLVKWKNKKQKPLDPIKPEEIPYDLPKSWEWVRLGDIINVRSSKRIFASEYKSDGIPFFRSKEIWDLSRWMPIRSELFISEEKYEEIKGNNEIPKVWDILLTSVGSIWNTWIVDDREFYYKDWNITQLEKTDLLNNLYLKYYISSDLFYSLVWNTVSGTAYNALTIEKINLLKFPLPPLQEQKRIIERIVEFMKSCELLDEQVKQAKERSEKLMESVLQGVFNW